MSLMLPKASIPFLGAGAKVGQLGLPNAVDWGCESTHTAQPPSSCLPLAHGCSALSDALSDGLLAVAAAALTRCHLEN